MGGVQYSIISTRFEGHMRTEERGEEYSVQVPVPEFHILFLSFFLSTPETNRFSG